MAADWTPSLRYPDPAITSLDKKFDKYRVMLTNVERLATGTQWGEGPVWFGDARCLIWSDVPGNKCGAGTRQPARPAYFARPPTMATAIPATGKAGSLPAST